MSKAHSSPVIGRRGLMGGVAAGAAFLAAPTILRAQTHNWIGVTAVPEVDFIGQSIGFFCDRVAELTDGQIQTTVHYGAALGGERDNIESLLQGAVHVASPGHAILSGWYPPAEVWTYPYLFRDVDHKSRAWDAIRDDYAAEAAEAGLRPLGSIPRMPRMLSANKVVTVPEDMTGMKIRVPETQMWLRTFERFGASPTPLPWPEVYQALRTGVIEAQENPVALTWNSGIFDVNSHLSLTEHMMQDNVIVIAEQQYQALGSDLQDALQQAARDMEDDMRPKVEADDDRILDLVREKGIIVSEVDKDAFVAALEGMPDEFEHVRHWVERVQDVA